MAIKSEEDAKEALCNNEPFFQVGGEAIRPSMITAARRESGVPTFDLADGRTVKHNKYEPGDVGDYLLNALTVERRGSQQSEALDPSLFTFLFSDYKKTGEVDFGAYGAIDKLMWGGETGSFYVINDTEVLQIEAGSDNINDVDPNGGTGTTTFDYTGQTSDYSMLAVSESAGLLFVIYSGSIWKYTYDGKDISTATFQTTQSQVLEGGDSAAYYNDGGNFVTRNDGQIHVWALDQPYDLTTVNKIRDVDLDEVLDSYEQLFGTGIAAHQVQGDTKLTTSIEIDDPRQFGETDAITPLVAKGGNFSKLQEMDTDPILTDTLNLQDVFSNADGSKVYYRDNSSTIFQYELDR